MARLFLTLLLLSALSSCLAVRPLRGLSRSLLQQPSPGASLRWSEEFNALDTASWNVVQGDGTGTPPGQGWGNGEAECYTNSPNNVRIVPSTDPSDSGNSWLSITALKQNTACNNGPSQPVTQQPWSSAKLTTQTKRSFMWTPTTNLRVEARIKIPASAGTWPAFWMLPEANEYGGWCNSGEIDIMEHINGLNRPIHGTLHYGGPWPTCIQSGGTTPAPTLTSGTPADWHVYAVEWAPEYLAFSMDGVEYYRVQRGTWWSGSARGVSSAPFDRPFYLILNLAIGGAWPCPGGMCDGTPLNNVNGPFTMLVDYIRVWDVPAGADRPATPSPTPSPLPSSQPFASPAPVEPVQPTTYPVCTFTAPCPQGTFYFCQAGGNANGCSTNPFPAGTSAVQCSQQCLSVKPTSSSPTPLPSPSPSRATPSPSLATPSDSSVSPYPSCSFMTPCPQGRYFYCQAGGNFNGCSANPFPAGTGVTQCSQQCLSIK